MTRAACMLVLALSACSSDVDEPWQLDHDRIIAVRAEPPGIESGARAELDLLIGRRGAPPTVEIPAAAHVVSPPSLAAALHVDGGRWIVTAPDAASLTAARVELGLAAGTPVPLVVSVASTGGFAATKTVWLGTSVENPELADVGIDGAAPAQELAFEPEVDIPLSVRTGEADDVNWLTSCGTLRDYDLPEAYLRIAPEDPADGELAVVVRAADGGVTWHVWPIRAEDSR